MDSEKYADLLSEIGLNDATLARRLSSAAGYTVQQTTLWRVRSGDTKTMPPGLAAYLSLLRDCKRAGYDVTRPPFVPEAEGAGRDG